MIEEFDLFESAMPRFKIDRPVRLIELFAGIGSQAKALKNLGVQFEHWKVIEWDRFAVASYNAIHGMDFTPKDISLTHAEDLEITDTEKYIYIMTYSFPCQDLSLAGNQKGMTKGSGTRSGLLWEVERILDECKELPQVLLMENVPQVIGSKNIKDFQLWRRKLESLGYSCYVQLLNGKEIGWPNPVPQNRNRCFMVSILGDYYYSFPTKQRLELRLKDVLEDNVDEKYYISAKQTQGMINTKFHQYSIKTALREKDGVAKTILERFEGAPQCVTIDDINKVGYLDKGSGEHQSNEVYSSDGVARAMTARDWRGAMMIVDEIDKVGYIEHGTGEHQSNQVYGTGGVARTLQGNMETKSPMMIVDDKK